MGITDRESHLSCCHAVRYEDEFVVGRAESFSVDVKPQPFEEENRHLREAVSALRAAVRTERGRREGVERECNLLLSEFSRLQTRVQVRCTLLLPVQFCLTWFHTADSNRTREIVFVSSLRTRRAARGG